MASENAPSSARAYNGRDLTAPTFEIGMLLELLGIPIESWANIFMLELRPKRDVGKLAAVYLYYDDITMLLFADYALKKLFG